MKLFERRHETCTVSTLGPADGGVVSIFSILPEKKEADPWEKRYERSRSCAKEEGDLTMDLACGAVGEGGIHGYKT